MQWLKGKFFACEDETARYLLAYEKAQVRGLIACAARQQAEIAALKNELDTLDITLRVESTKLGAVTQHLYRIQNLPWRLQVLMAVFTPERLWRV